MEKRMTRPQYDEYMKGYNQAFEMYREGMSLYNMVNMMQEVWSPYSFTDFQRGVCDALDSLVWASESPRYDGKPWRKR